MDEVQLSFFFFSFFFDFQLQETNSTYVGHKQDLFMKYLYECLAKKIRMYTKKNPKKTHTQEIEFLSSLTALLQKTDHFKNQNDKKKDKKIINKVNPFSCQKRCSKK
jgi:hypothetical protein